MPFVLFLENGLTSIVASRPRARKPKPASSDAKASFIPVLILGTDRIPYDVQI